MYVFLDKKSFTLIELLVVIGILAVLSTAVLLVLNPIEYLKQSRDATRASDLKSIDSALTLVEQQDPTANFGVHQKIYVSVPDIDSGCANLGLPTLPSGWTYGCVDSAHLQNTDGTGWIPVDFQSVPAINLSALPIDPINSTSTGDYYTYTPGSWELTAHVESSKYEDVASKVSNGTNTTRLQIGSNMSLLAQTVYGGAAPQAPVQQDVSTITSSITADKYSLDADGNSLVTFTITAKDASGNPISSASVVLSSTGSSNTFSQPSNTNSSGQTTGTLKSTAAENKTISATINGTLINSTAVITFNTQCSGTDFAGADFTATSTITLSSSAPTVYCNVGTFSIPAGITWNLGQTQRLEIRAQNVSIAGTINATGKGYGTNLGPGKMSANGCGASYGGYGVCTSGPSLNGNAPYGSAIAPDDFGSGSSSGGGGGLVKIYALGMVTVNGSIAANGTNGDSPASGGAVYISADTLAGSGSITANGGVTGYQNQGAGGGRIALYYSSKTFSGTLTAAASGLGTGWGAAGTIFEKNTSQSTGVIAVDVGTHTTFGYTSLLGIDSSVTSVNILNGGHGLISSASSPNADVVLNSTSSLIMYGSNTLKSLTVNSGGTVTHGTNSSSKVNYIDLTAANVTINSGGSINADGKGYAAQQGPGKSISSWCGGSYGGYGYNNNPVSMNTNGSYGSATNPSDMGSGGWDSAGGGYIKIISSGTLTNNGTITASGIQSTATGSGGSIYISAGTFAGSGSILAISRFNYQNQAGSGGRIALYYTTKTFTGTVNASGYGGGGAGTIFDKANGQSTGTLTIDNSGNATSAYTPVDTGIDSTVGSIIISNKGYGLASSTSISNIDVTVSTSTLVMLGSNTLKSMTVNSGGTVTTNSNSTSKVNYIDLTAANVTINSGGSMNVSGKGYAYNTGPGKPISCNTGGGHGGAGQGAGGGPTYDSLTAPADLGSGGCQAPGSGGGLVKLIVPGALTINGTINANGADSDSPGSGGSIYISSGTFAGSGSITANGGATGYSQGAGGGRIAYYYTSKTFSGTITANKSQSASNGTIYDGGSGSYPGPLGMIQNNNLAKKDKSENLFANILSIFSNWLK